ncbi:MAG: hypothetical protein ABIJ30_13160 [bacterium]
MAHNISRVVRSTFGLVAIGLCIFGAVVIHIWILFSNYSGVTQSFELLGYDQKALSDNRLLGWLFESILLGDATQCELYAGALVLTMAVTIAMVCHLISQAINHYRDYKIFLRAGDDNSAGDIKLTLYYNVLPWLILYFPVAFIISLWDVYLFRYRAFAGVFGVEDTETAVSMGNTGVLLKEYGDSFSIGLTQFSAMGYVVIVIATSFLLAFLLSKLSDRWELFINAFASLFIWDESNPQQATTQTHTDSTSEDISAEQSQGTEETTHEAGVPIPLGEVSGEDSSSITAMQQTRFNMDEEVEIIGDSNNRRIKKSQAIKDNNRFYVDSEGKVWDRGYYDSIL